MTFRGKRADLDALLEAFAATPEVAHAEVIEVASAGSELFAREPLNQVELISIVISFTINVAAAFTYDQIRSLLQRRASEKHFEEKPFEEEDDAAE